MSKSLKLYQIVASDGTIAENEDGKTIYFSSKFSARNFRDSLNQENETGVNCAAEAPWHIASGPDHKKTTGKKKAWNH